MATSCWVGAGKPLQRFDDAKEEFSAGSLMPSAERQFPVPSKEFTVPSKIFPVRLHRESDQKANEYRPLRRANRAKGTRKRENSLYLPWITANWRGRIVRW